MTTNEFNAGDDYTLVIPCYDEVAGVNTPRVVSGTVTAIFMRGGVKIAPTTSWSCLSSTPGANWPNGLVAIPIPRADTDAMATTAKDVIIEIKIDTGTAVNRYRSTLEDAIKIIKKGH